MKGSCHCGAIRFEVRGEVRRTSFCHCSQCRKQSGGVWASADVAREALEIKGPVRWFAASPKARRGFCPDCGAYLFWEAGGSGEIAFALGAVDGPSGLTVTRHLFVPDVPPVRDGQIQGTCLCAGVGVVLGDAGGEVTACHCVQCRKVSGHLPFSLDDPDRRARIEGALATYRSPGGAIRSFCPNCGSKIFFDGPSGLLSVYAGLFGSLRGHEPDLHIFTSFKGDYYTLPPGSRMYLGAGPD